MKVRLPTHRATVGTLVALAVLTPGWSAVLVPADHEAILAAASGARHLTGVVATGPEPGAEWHLQYLDSWWVRMLDELGLRSAAPSLVPPDFAAHLPPGSSRADAYFRVESSLRWPWWWPGGGVDWAAAPR